MTTLEPSPPLVAAAVVVATTYVLQQNKQRLKSIINAYKSRRELRKIARNKVHNQPDDDSAQPQPRVSGIFIHPVKSLRPVALSQTKFDTHGLVGDRRLMIVRPLPTPLYGHFMDGEATHRFLTQRQSPSLATVDATEPITLDSSKTLIKLSSSLVTDDEHVTINVHPSAVKSFPIRYLAGVWNDVIQVADVGDEAAAFVSKVVCKDDPNFKDVRVVSVMQSSERRVDELYCPDAARVGILGSLPQGGLTDGFPVSCFVLRPVLLVLGYCLKALCS